MVNFTILAGGFSTAGFIATYVFDSTASTLSLTQNSSTGANPSWIASHPTNKSILYAVNENSPVGDLQSFSVTPDGAATLVNTVSSQGNGPTFTVPLSTGEVTAMNFGSPNSSFVATDPNDPLVFRNDSPIIDFPVNGGPSNPHMSLEFNDEILVPDLGADKIWRLTRNGDPGNFKVTGQINIDAGAGPRHIAILDNILFTIHEKTSTLTAQQIPQGPNGTTLPLIANVSVIPTDPAPPAGAAFAAAEIFISNATDKFPEPLIYVSNRNIGNVTDPAGDTIAIFRFKSGAGEGQGGPNASASGTDGASASGEASATETASAIESASATGPAKRGMSRIFARSRHLAQIRRQDPPASQGTLELVAQIPTGLQQIRSMAIGPVGDGADEFIVAGANTEGGVAVFQRVDGGQNLTLVARNLDVANRTSFVFL